MNTIRQIERINSQELARAARLDGTKGSWHDDYRHSPYIYIGGLPFELNEGDILSIFSQYGTIIDIDLAREASADVSGPSPNLDRKGKSKGFAFVGYEDQRSTVLAVDNFNGIKILGRTIRVDHCTNYRGARKANAQAQEKSTSTRSAATHSDHDSNDAAQRLYGVHSPRTRDPAGGASSQHEHALSDGYKVKDREKPYHHSTEHHRRRRYYSPGRRTPPPS
ncbi:RNA-binding protein Cwf29 [Mitosporidium daphniae]